MQLNAGVLLDQRRPLRFGFLHAVFAEHARWPASITGSIASAANVFDTATNVTSDGSRSASLQARAICVRTDSSAAVAVMRLPIAQPR
jgi:lactam utilization protein B